MIAEGLSAALRACRHLVVFTGAGVSRESGIPTFRDAQTGLWAHYDAEQLATPEAFAADPDLVWGWYAWRQALVLGCEPNAGHRAIAALQDCVPKLSVITQNVDGLHQRAGSRDVIELHGSLFQPRCAICAHDAPSAVLQSGEKIPQRLPPPRCPECQGPIRPGVVWFGEMLPEIPWQRAAEAVQACDLLLCVGTSALVYPAAALPMLAAQQGTVVQINPEPTALDEHATFNLRGRAASVLPQLLAQFQP